MPVVGSTPIHIPLKYRYLIKIRNWIGQVYPKGDGAKTITSNVECICDYVINISFRCIPLTIKRGFQCIKVCLIWIPCVKAIRVQSCIGSMWDGLVFLKGNIRSEEIKQISYRLSMLHWAICFATKRNHHVQMNLNIHYIDKVPLGSRQNGSQVGSSPQRLDAWESENTRGFILWTSAITSSHQSHVTKEYFNLYLNGLDLTTQNANQFQMIIRNTQNFSNFLSSKCS
jgi:hypothetical protein